MVFSVYSFIYYVVCVIYLVKRHKGKKCFKNQQLFFKKNEKFFSGMCEIFSQKNFVIDFQNVMFAKNFLTMEGNLYTPAEIVERNPILLERNWTAQNIGYLFNCQLLNGVKKSRCTYIDEASVLRLFFINFPTLLTFKQ